MNYLTADLMASKPAATRSAPVDAKAKVHVTNSYVMTVGSAIVLLPNLLFAAHLQTLPAAAIALGAAGFAVLQWRLPLAPDAILDRAVHLPRLVICLAVAIMLLLLGGEGHVFFANWDWLWRDAVLADLVRAPFPPSYQVGNQSFFLRAPLGMYMLPALVGQATNLGAAHLALLAQNSALLTVILYMLATLAGRRAWLIVAVFIGFSGLDALGQLIMWLKSGRSLFAFEMPSHIEGWIGLQYSSTITQLFWVPNHALPGMWLAILVMLGARRELTPADLGVVMAASLFWSPFALIGTLPFAAYLIFQEFRATLVAVRFWLALASALCFLPVALYMKIDAAEVPHGLFLLEPRALATIGLFLLVELAPLAVIRKVWVDLDPWLRGVLGVAIVFLGVLPMFQVGASNDLVMRASIPALMILAFAFGESLAIAWQGQPGLFAVALGIALVGAITPAKEIIRALEFSPFAISGCNLVTVWQKIDGSTPLSNYFARREALPPTLVDAPQTAPLVDRPVSVCWPDMPLDPLALVGQQSDRQLRENAAKAVHHAL